MPDVVAIVDNKILRLRSRDEAPPGATLCEGPADLERLGNSRTLDDARRAILRTTVIPGGSAARSAQLLWDAILLYVKPHSPSPKKVRGPKRLIERLVLRYEPGKDSMRDFLVCHMPHQSRTILMMLVEDGRKSWTNDELLEVIAANSAQFQSRQPIDRVFAYYRTRLIQGGFLAKQSSWERRP